MCLERKFPPWIPQYIADTLPEVHLIQPGITAVAGLQIAAVAVGNIYLLERPDKFGMSRIEHSLEFIDASYYRRDTEFR